MLLRCSLPVHRGRTLFSSRTGTTLPACLLALFSALMTLPAPAGAAESASGTGKVTGGIAVGATRVIYNEADNGATVRVINTSSIPFLIQTWVESYKGYGAEKTAELPKGTFITTPPLYRQDRGENSVRIVRARGDFPRDRESVFWLNIKSIAASEKPSPETNYVQFAFNTRIKLFYRPAGLTGKPSEAYRALTFSRAGNTLTATNPTVYNVTVNSLKVGGVTVEDADQRMVPPKGTQSWTLPEKAHGNSVTYVSLNDFGGLTPPLTVTAR
ncbi:MULTISPECIES: fimbrial biogenesis chaperone [Enterobacter cloacae complex]|uniref:fimbrial biogenesis chaperone n=1 Tax=Enterobacter cloacae complex TaxID=354276 RepID=UPI001FFF8CFA|nr:MULTISPECIES: molecular chaperone [Enterobacter cloacae complex]MCK2177817.1 molecular chaperone [Enterobacter asburiae]